MSNNPVAIISDGSMGVAHGRVVTSNITLGTPTATGKRAWIQKTYASQYNHAVECWESFGGSNIKRRMRGGHFLLYPLLVFVVIVISFILGSLSNSIKFYATFPVVTSVIYLTITIWNWHVFRTNGDLIHSHMIRVSPSMIPGWTNEFFTIPIQAEITDRQVLGVVHEAGAVFAQLVEQHRGETSIKIMVYIDSYLNKVKFPAESIFHFIIFLVALIVGIARAASNPT